MNPDNVKRKTEDLKEKRQKTGSLTDRKRAREEAEGANANNE